MHFPTLTCDYLGQAYKHTHRHTQNIISGLLVTKYKSDPITPLYLLMFVFLLFSSISSFIGVLMGVLTTLTCSI
jgi:hypothetical protein